MTKRFLTLFLALFSSFAWADWQTFIAEETKRLPADDTPYVSLDRAIAHEAKAEAAWLAKDGTVSDEDLAVYRYYVYARVLALAPYHSLGRHNNAEAQLQHARTTPSQGWNYEQRRTFLHVAYARALALASHLNKVSAEALKPVTNNVGDEDLLWTDPTLMECFLLQTFRQATYEDDPATDEKRFPEFDQALSVAAQRLKDALDFERLVYTIGDEFDIEIDEEFNIDESAEDDEAFRAAEYKRYETFIARPGLTPSVRHAAILKLVDLRQEERDDLAHQLTLEDVSQKRAIAFPKGAESMDALGEIVETAKLYHLRWQAQQQANLMRAKSVAFIDAPAFIPVHATQPQRFAVQYTNTNHVVLSLQKISLSPIEGTVKPEGEPIVQTYALPPIKDYAIGTTFIDCPALPHGTYELSLSFKDYTFDELKQTPDRSRLMVSDFNVACVSENPVTYFVADTQTGRPCIGATLTCGEASATTNDLGLAVLSLPAPKWNLRKPITVTYNGQSLVHTNTYENRPRASKSTRYLSYPNAGLYRPGDTVKVQLLALQTDATGRRKEAAAHHEASLEITGRSANGDTLTFVKSHPITFSERGAYDLAFDLPQTFVGALTMRLSTRGNHHYVALPEVLEFKPPAMRTQLELTQKDACFGEAMALKINAVDASNVPLSGAIATCKIIDDITGNPTSTETLTLDAQGLALLSFVPHVPPAHQDSVYGHIEVSVVAANGERADASQSFVQYRHGYRLTLNAPRWKIENEPFEVHVASDEKPDFKGTLEVYKWNTKASKRGERLLTLDFDAVGKGTVNCPLNLPAGNYQLRVVSGKVEDTLKCLVLPLDGDLSKVDFADVPYSYWHPSQRVSFVLNNQTKSAFAVGETLEAYIAAKVPVPFFYAITTLDGTTTFRPCNGPRFNVPITPDMIGNANIMVFGLYQGRYYHASERISITPPPELTVKAARVPETVLPGSTQTWELTVDDPSAEMIITCYDAMVDRVRPLHWPLINSTFPTLGWSYLARLRPFYEDQLYLTYMEALPRDPCGEAMPVMLKRAYAGTNAIRTLGGGERMAKQRAYAPMAMEMDAVVEEPLDDYEAEGEDDEGNEAIAPIRSNFARMATWVPQKRLVEGKAVFTFTLPDTLTTWQLRALAYTPDGRSGLLEQHIVAKREVMLRPYFPRLLRANDSLVLRTAVANTTDKPITTWVELNGRERREVTLAPNASTTLAWSLTARPTEGTQVLEFTSPYDALRVELPVYDNRVAVEDVYPITLQGTAPYRLELLTPTPETTFSERWNHRPNDLVITALRQQLKFPYACAEQTFAKLNALLLLKAYDAAPVDADTQIAKLQGHLLSMRKAGGLWPWFPEGHEDPMISAEICIGAARLKRLGYLPVELEAAVREVLEKHADKLPFPAWLYARTAWLESWPLQEDFTDECLRERKFAGIQERLYLIAAAQQLGIDLVAKQGLETVLQSMTTSELWGTQWPQERTWWRWYDTPIETHVLRAEILRQAGRLKEAEGAALWLMQNARMNDWGTTRATTSAVYCLLQSEIAKQDTKAPTVTMTKVEQPATKTTEVTYQKDTQGLSFGSLSVAYKLPLNEVPALTLPSEYGLTLTRTYTPAQPKVGETIKVTLRIDAAQPLDRLWLEDLRPAHTEPIRQTPSWHWQSRAYLLPGDKGLDIFIGELPRGTTVIEYELKATHEGTCQPGLATLRSMYAPDFATRTTAQPMVVNP